MVAWYRQWEHFSRAEHLRRAAGPHDVVVRSRLDLLLPAPLLVAVLPELEEAALGSSTEPSGVVYALSHRAVNADGFTPRPCTAADPRAESMEEAGHANADTKLHCATYHRDWLYVSASEAATAVLAGMAYRPLLHALPQRCKGWCQEEQMRLQLLRADARLAPLRANLSGASIARLSARVAKAHTPARDNQGAYASAVAARKKP